MNCGDNLYCVVLYQRTEQQTMAIYCATLMSQQKSQTHSRHLKWAAVRQTDWRRKIAVQFCIFAIANLAKFAHFIAVLACKLAVIRWRAVIRVKLTGELAGYFVKRNINRYLTAAAPSPPTDNMSCDDCLNDKRENYQNCFLLYCAITVTST